MINRRCFIRMDRKRLKHAHENIHIKYLLPKTIYPVRYNNYDLIKLIKPADSFVENIYQPGNRYTQNHGEI